MSQPDTTIKDRIMIFMGDNLHVVLEDEGDQSVIPTEKFAQDLAEQLNQLITRSKIDELEKTINRMDVNKTDYADTYHYLHDRLTNLKESLNE